MDTPPDRAKLQEVLETIPNNKWTAIGKCLLENDMLNQQVLLKRRDSEPRGDVFLDVLHNLADDHSRATVSWKQLMNILQMQLGYSHEAISLVMEVVGQYSLGKHGYGSTAVQCEGSHSRSRGVTDSLMDSTTPLLLQGNLLGAWLTRKEHQNTLVVRFHPIIYLISSLTKLLIRLAL